MITKTAEILHETPPLAPHAIICSADQFLLDLETLTWIIENEPEQRQPSLLELYQHYHNAPALTMVIADALLSNAQPTSDLIR